MGGFQNPIIYATAYTKLAKEALIIESIIASSGVHAVAMDEKFRTSLFLSQRETY